MALWFEGITKKDARLLVAWWNAHTSAYYFMRRDGARGRRGRLWNVYRQT